MTSETETLATLRGQRDAALSALQGARSVVRQVVAERNEVVRVVDEATTAFTRLRPLIPTSTGAAIIDAGLSILARAKDIAPETAETAALALDSNAGARPELEGSGI